MERGQASHITRTSDEVPFGTKAMLEDPDVNGVWNTRTSTPLQSPRLRGKSHSPSLSSIKMFSKSPRNSSTSSVCQISLQHLPVLTSPTRSASTHSTTNHHQSCREPVLMEHDIKPNTGDGEVQEKRSVIIKAKSRLNLFDGEGGTSKCLSKALLGDLRSV